MQFLGLWESHQVLLKAETISELEKKRRYLRYTLENKQMSPTETYFSGEYGKVVPYYLSGLFRCADLEQILKYLIGIA